MKKIAFILSLTTSSFLGLGQVIHPTEPWVLTPNIFNTSVDPPTNTSIGYGPTGSSLYTNSCGAFDEYKNLRFFVQDLTVYYSGGSFSLPTYNSGPPYYNTWGNAGHELSIVPVPGNCNQYYIIYELNTTSSGGGGHWLAYVLIDCSSGTPVMTTPSNNFLDGTQVNGIAVSNLTSGNIRYLFTVDYIYGTNMTLERFTIGSWNSSTSQGITSKTAIGSSQTGNASDISEMSLSPDQSRIAWNCDNGANKIYETSLTSSYGYSSFTTYNIPSATNIVGLEYAQLTSATIMYVSSDAGITYFNPGLSPTYHTLSTNLGYGKTQLRLMQTGNIMGVYHNNSGSTNEGNLFEINVSGSIGLSSNTTQVFSLAAPNGSSSRYIYHLPSDVLIPALTPFISNSTAYYGSNVTAVGTYTGNTTPNNYFWGITQVDQYGNVISGGYSWSNWYSGSPSGTFTFPSTNNLPCGYYRIALALQNTTQCLNWEVTTQQVQLGLDPTFNMIGNVLTGGTTYTGTATYHNTSYTSSNPSGFGYLWDVVQTYGAGGSSVSGTDVNNPSCWWTYPTPLKFSGYNGTSSFTCGTPSVGHFTMGDYYSITLGMWSTSCPYVQYTYDLQLCGLACRTAENPNGIIITPNLNAPDLSSYIQNTTSITNNNDIESNIVIYPNPSNGILNINLSSLNEGKIIVNDMLGKKIFEDEIKNHVNEYSLNLSAYDKGIYSIHITSNGATIIKKIIIQ